MVDVRSRRMARSGADPREALDWLAALQRGLGGRPFRNIITNTSIYSHEFFYSHESEASGRDYLHTVTTILDAVATSRSLRPIGETQLADWEEAEQCPLLSSQPWYELGQAIRSWNGSFEQECERLIQDDRNLTQGERVYRSLKDMRLPSLSGILRSMASVNRNFVRGMVTVRIFVSTMSKGGSECKQTSEREVDHAMWNSLIDCYNIPRNAGRDVLALHAMYLLEKGLIRDLTFLSCGKLPYPRWDEGTGMLTIDGVPVKKPIAVERAKRVCRVLDSFELSGWPERIELPKDDDDVQIHQTLKSLNKGLSRLRFRADGSGAGVRWELTE